MAMLIPLLLPHIVAASANIGLGLSNAIQGDSSSVSLQIGNKVFTTKKSCNLNTLPAELRIRIILMALEESKSLILPIPAFINPAEPLLRREMREIESHNPFNPESDHYGSIMGDTVEANGYPISAWRWSLVSREWRDVLKDPLWRHLEVKGSHRYFRLVKRLSSKGGVPQLSRVKRLTLREGFGSPEDLYAILSAPTLTSLESIAIMPDYPTPYHQLVYAIPSFPFGLQLIRTARPTRSLMYGLPLESTTNSSSRQQLKHLRPPHLALTFVRPYVTLFEELSELVAETTDFLTIRYVPLRGLVDVSVLLCQPLQSFKRIDLLLLLPRPRMMFVGEGDNRTMVEDPESSGKRFVTTLVEKLEIADEEVRERYTVWLVDEWDIPGRAHKAVKTKLWPKQAFWEFDDLDGDDDEKADDVVTSSKAHANRRKEHEEQEEMELAKPKGKQAHWERETNLRLLGGLFNLRLESKKR